MSRSDKGESPKVVSSTSIRSKSGAADGRPRHRARGGAVMVGGLTPTTVLGVSLAIALTLVVSLNFHSAWSSFSSIWQHNSNNLASGTVTLSDNTANGSTLFTSTAMKPGTTVSACVNLTYSGDLPAAVKTYMTTTGTGLDQYVTLTLTRGTLSSPSGTSCASFAADASGSQLYSGNLSAVPTTYAAGIADTNTAWSTAEAHAYKFDLTLQDTDSAQGKTASTTVYFESRSN